jgi:hypothetical protein
VVIKNERLIEQAKKGYQNAIFDMRPDGTFPTDVSRGGSGLQYQNTAVNALVSMAGYSTLIGENWIEYEVNGRSIRDAAEWIDKASADPRLNAIYGRLCDGGSYGTIDKPNMNYLKLENTGETNISWVPLYLMLTNDALNFLSKNIRDYNGYWSTSIGPQSCIVDNSVYTRSCSGVLLTIAGEAEPDKQPPDYSVTIRGKNHIWFSDIFYFKDYRNTKLKGKYQRPEDFKWKDTCIPMDKEFSAPEEISVRHSNDTTTAGIRNLFVKRIIYDGKEYPARSGIQYPGCKDNIDQKTEFPGHLYCAGEVTFKLN